MCQAESSLLRRNVWLGLDKINSERKGESQIRGNNVKRLKFGILTATYYQFHL